MAAVAVAARHTPAWGPSACPQRAARPPQLRIAARSTARAASSTAEQELLSAVKSLGYPAAIFPGDEQARARIDQSIAALEACTPTPSPLAQPDRGGQPAPELIGDWQLIYASNGTYVTRTAAAQALLAASKLPGVGVSDIRQGLELPLAAGSSSSGSSNSSVTSSSNSSSSSGSGSGTVGSKGSGSGTASGKGLGQLRTSNVARFGLGPFGDWELAIQGVWAIRDASLARVSFDGFSLQLVGLLGLIKLPSMAKVSIPIANSRTADFTTTYVSASLRVARGRTQNIFLFNKLPNAS